VLEAVHAGVPLLCVPVFVDQPYNAYAAESRGLCGRVLDPNQFTVDELADAIGAVLPWKAENRWGRPLFNKKKRYYPLKKL
jgi:UDP:flavonoid glycosyltransferase YjiC (YdhE family)